MSRRRKLLVLVVLALGAASTLVLLWPKSHETLLGGPPRNYGRYADGEITITLELYIPPPGSVEKVWCDDSNLFQIYFDAEGRVVAQHQPGYSQMPRARTPASMWRSIRAWLGL